MLGVRDVVGAEDPLAGVALEGQEICGTRGRRSAPRLPHGPHPAPRCRRAPRPPALTQALAGGPRAVSPQVRELHGGPLSRSPAPRPFPSRRHAGRGRGRHHPRGGHGAAPRSRQRAAPGATPPLFSASPPDPPPSSRSGSPHPGVLRSAPPARPKPRDVHGCEPGEPGGGEATSRPGCAAFWSRSHAVPPPPTPSPSRSLPCPSSGGRSAASLPGRRTDAKRRPSAVRRSSRLSSRCFEVSRSPAAVPKGCGQSRGLLGPPAACSLRDARRGRGRKRRGTGPGVNFIDCKNSTAAQ